MKAVRSLKARIQSALRRSWSRSWERSEALRKARVSRGVYQCQKCKCHAGRKLINVDHHDPIGAFIDWNHYVERLFCSVDNLKVLCIDCHKKKTAREATARAKARKRAKK